MNTMLEPYPRKFRDDVVRVVENCEPGNDINEYSTGSPRSSSKY